MAAPSTLTRSYHRKLTDRRWCFCERNTWWSPCTWSSDQLSKLSPTSMLWREKHWKASVVSEPFTSSGIKFDLTAKNLQRINWKSDIVRGKFCSLEFIWSQFRISFTDSKVWPTLLNNINSTKGKCCSVAFTFLVSRISPTDSKLEPPFTK